MTRLMSFIPFISCRVDGGMTRPWYIHRTQLILVSQLPTCLIRSITQCIFFSFSLFQGSCHD